MKSKASIKGHPVHPMLVTLPIGLLTASLVADFVYLARGETFWYDFAWWTMAGGIAGALLAAVPGLIDYFGVVRKSAIARATGRMHMLINLTVVAVYAVNLYLRSGQAALGGGRLGTVVTLSVLSMLTLGFSGWLGGRLVYRYGVGVDREQMRVTMLEEERVRTPR